MNPVLQKDILSLLRQPRIAAIQVLFVAVLGVTLLATWPQQGLVALADRGKDSMLLGVIMSQLALLCLIIPGLAATGLSGETEAGTIEMLYASRLSPGQIILGKVLSAISFPLLLLVTGLPFLAMLYWRGEVNLRDLWLSYLILALSAVMLAMLALTVSALCRQSATALVVSYLLVLVIGGASLVPASIMLSQQTGLGGLVLHGLRGLSPIAAELSVLRPQIDDLGGSDHQLRPIWQFYLPAACLVIVLCFAVIVSRLRKPPAEAAAFGGGDVQKSRLIRILTLIDPKKKRKPFGSLNPIMVKEARTSNLRSGRWMIRLFYSALVISLGLALMSLYGGSEYGDLLASVARVLVMFQFGLIALVAPSLSSSAISTEIEAGTFDMVRLSRLRGGKIFWGKFLPGFLPAALPMLALLPGYGAICFINHEYIVKFIYIIPVIVLAVVFCCTLGLCCSCFTSNTSRATVTSYLLSSALFVLPLGAWVATDNGLSERIAQWLAMPSPLVIGLSLLSDSTQIQALWSLHLWTMSGLCLLLLVVARIRLSRLLKHG